MSISMPTFLLHMAAPGTSEIELTTVKYAITREEFAAFDATQKQ